MTFPGEAWKEIEDFFIPRQVGEDEGITGAEPDGSEFLVGFTPHDFDLDEQVLSGMVSAVDPYSG